MNKKILLFLLLGFLLHLVNTVQEYSDTDVDNEESQQEFFLDKSIEFSSTKAGRWFSFSHKNIAGLVVLLFVGGLASAGGVSGGSLFMCILVTFFDYSVNFCVQIIYGLVFAGSLGNVINVSRNRDQATGRPLIDYNLTLLLMPPMALGANIGVVLSRMAAPIVIIALLYLMLIYSVMRILKRWRVDRMREREVGRPIIEIVQQGERTSNQESRQNPPEELALVPANPELQTILKEELKLFPLRTLAILTVLLLGVVAFILLRGTGNYGSVVNIIYCSTGYWTLFVGGLIFCCFIGYTTQAHLKHVNRVKTDHGITQSTSGYPILESKDMIKLSILSFIAGVLGGLLGIGGIMVLIPTLLKKGFKNASVMATCSFLILQTTFISLFQSLLYGDVSVSLEGLFMGISLVGALMVSSILKWIVEKYRRPSLLLLVLLIILFASMIAIPVSEIINYYGNFGAMFEFYPLCTMAS